MLVFWIGFARKSQKEIYCSVFFLFYSIVYWSNLVMKSDETIDKDFLSTIKNEKKKFI